MNSLSSFQRSSTLREISSQQFDAVIIGGGITGAGIALDAASRGLKVCLIEKQDFASGTSSRSTKLIHGGLRYLKNFEFGLVMEVAKERKIIYRNAPHLVSREKLLLPLIKNGSFGKYMTSVGLTVYDVMARVGFEEWHKMLSAEETVKQEPLLKSDILLGSGFFSEYRTDDARLTIEVIKTAAKYGAIPINYVEATGFLYEKGKISGLSCVDEFTSDKFELKANVVINASGPWVDELRKKDEEKTKEKTPEKRLHLTKGVHIMFAWEDFPLNHSVYFDTKDKRMIFAIPRGKTTYIGTTDTNYTGKLENPIATSEDVEYLINATNRVFPTVNLRKEIILSSWAGLRPLIHEEGKSPSELSRKDEIIISKSGLISIAGGKLSGYRKMAEKTVDILCKRLGKKQKCISAGITLNGGEFELPPAVKQYVKEVEEKIKTAGLQSYHAEYLVNMYGKQSEDIITKLHELNSSDPQPGLVNLAKAELWFAMNFESVQKISDFFVRRTARLLFEPWSVKPLLGVIADEMKKELKWSDERAEAEKIEMQILIKQAVTFP